MTRLYGRGARGGFSFVDLLVVLLVVPLLAAFVVGCYRHSRGEGAGRVKCSSNLRQIALAMIMYANDNKGRFPLTTYAADSKPVWGTGAAATQPFDGDGPQPNDVSAAMFMVLREQDITSEAFVCPESNAVKDTFGGAKTAKSRCNFTNVKANLSYSYQDPYINAEDPKPMRLNVSLSSDYPILSDMNPGTAGNTPVDNVVVAYDANQNRMKHANSNNHDGDGQNVAYTDAHVEWFTSPFAGVQRGASRDNIYTAANEADNASGGAGSLIAAHPVDGNDSILLPTDD